MNDDEKSREELLEELGALRARVRELEVGEALRNEALDALQTSEKRYQLMVKTANDAIFFVEADSGIIIGLNRKAEELLGAPAEELIGLHQSQIYPENERDWAMDKFKDVGRGTGSFIKDIHIQRWNGVLVPVEVSANVQEIGGRRVVQGIFRDVSRSVNVEKSIKIERDIALDLSTTSDLSESARKISERLLTLDEVSACGICFAEVETGMMRMIANHGFPPDIANKLMNVSFSSSMAELIIQGEVVLTTYKELMSRLGMEDVENQYKAFAVVPICYKEQIVGAIHIASRDNDVLSDFTRHIIETIAVQVGGAFTRLGVEAEVRRGDRQFRDLFRQMLSAFAMYEYVEDRHDYKLIDINPAYERIVGRNRSEAVGMRIREILPETDWGWIKVFDNARASSYPYDFEIFNPSTKKYFQGTVYVASKVRVAAIFMDITDRKKVEEELGRLATAVEQAAETIMISDTDGFIQYVNPAFEVVSGFSRSEVIGKHISIQKSDEHPKEFHNEVWTKIKSGETWRGRFINKKKDGSLFEEEAIISPIKDPRGNVINYVAVKRDISKEVRMEMQLRQAQKIESIGRLAGGLAHDLNNLLVPMLGYTDLALMQSEDWEGLKENLGLVRGSAEKIRNLSKQLLAFSRRQVLEKEVLNLNEVISDFCEMLKMLLREDIRMFLELDENLGYVHADVVQLEQIIMNLVVNARDAMPDGGELYIRTENIALSQESTEDHLELSPGDYVLFSVRDTGKGMQESTLEHLFEPFFTTKITESGQGTGLGLATVHGIVKQHYGHIEAESSLGNGATFNIYFPRVEAPEKKTPEISSKGDSETMKSGKETVLLVEDDEMVLRLVEKVLASQGYNVVHASGGEAALEIVDSFDGIIDLLMTDVIMPVMNGKDLFKKIAERIPGLKVLFMSGYTDNVIGQHGMNEPGISFIQKPFSVAEIVEKVRTVLDE